MEAEVKQVIKEKEYVHGEDRKEYASKGVGNAALTTGIIGTALGAAALWGRGGRIFGGGMPENVNINTVSDAIAGRSGVAPTAFQAWEKGCEEALSLTNTIWGLKVNTQEQMYAHREIDINEKWQLYKSQVDGDFGNYKVSRDLYDNSMAIQEMVNAELLLLVKGRIEASAEGKAILEQQLSFVRRTSKTAKEETARRDALFREYVTEHSDMTWQEFIDWKNGKPQSKSKK